MYYFMFSKREKNSMYIFILIVTTDKEIMKPNIEPDRKPQVQKIELRGSGCKFIHQKTLDQWKNCKTIIKFYFTNNKNICKIVKLFTIIVLNGVSKLTCIQQEIFHKNFVILEEILTKSKHRELIILMDEMLMMLRN